MTRKLRILLAEDNPDHAELFQDVLQNGHGRNTLVHVGSGEQVVERLKTTAPEALPDLILLDVNMPRMNGKEALRAIKADPALCAIPVAMITTSGSAAEIRECFDLGACSYLQKPLHFDAFVTKLESFLNYWTQVSELPARHTTDHG